MNRQTTISSRDLGLEFASICGRYFLGLEHLHYGYWPDGLPVNIHNLRAAQEHYTNFLVSHIPAGIRSILDVGCGSGQTSKHLVELGYSVACVSPSPMLSGRVRQLIGDAGQVFECRFEELQTDGRFDLVLFSESFQYIRLTDAIEKAYEILKPAGYMLICDVFRKDVKEQAGKNGVGGGHRLAKFYREIENLPFERLEDVDITSRTSPNLQLLDEAMQDVARPIVDSGMDFLAGRYPLMSRLLGWLYRRRIEAAYGKYFKGARSSVDFESFKTYRLFLYRSISAVPADSKTTCTDLNQTLVTA
ncbi:MAG: class I SAM-dependent methyltransferase [Sedimentisphaerales bacterium]|nr:class I SAM-dependent methyltransferase [Sedimentisphaerales bacterium]